MYFLLRYIQTGYWSLPITTTQHVLKRNGLPSDIRATGKCAKTSHQSFAQPQKPRIRNVSFFFPNHRLVTS
ncbi:hypothetical protein XELAEV_18032954mg [Xenopus laevis]|uniref:Uncharacterized protein n=1 Tax=Xenopus laevis TaxID=8355 RepID=A0A974CJE1_XENLA|nr:hypothetical protein XELAEV_18032954mg [Xenopus laevis]